MDSDRQTGLTQVTLKGEIVRVVFTNPDNGYCVFRLADAQGVEYMVTGMTGGLYAGQHVEVTGYWENHRDYGRQLRADAVKFVLPNTPDGICRYLASGVIPGLGPKLAKCIVDQFGDQTLEVMDRYSSRLLEIPGFGKKRLKAIKAAWDEQQARRDIFIFMQSLGISPAYCQRIYRTYGNTAPAIIRQEPYRLADDVDGIGFVLADRVAAAQNIVRDDPARIAAGITYSLNQVKLSGHCCYPETAFLQYAAELLEVPTTTIAAGLQHAAERNRVVLVPQPDGNMVYERIMYRAETELPQLVAGLLTVRRHRGALMAKVPPLEGQQFTAEQYRAVTNAAQSPVSIITGGPGVGKTTVIGEIVRRARSAKLKIYLAAPTGRAAQRLSETSGIAARTIHRLLKWEPEERRFAYGLELKLPCDLLIVDEVSMLDVPLAVQLFRAIAPGTTVVLVGDADQLPSVGPGEVLNDFIASGIFAVTRLTRVFRQGAGSAIIANAHAVNAGRMPELGSGREDKNILRDFYWIEQDDPDKAVELIVRMVSERIPERFGMRPMRDIQVLSPMNRGSCGTVVLNEVLQAKLNGGHKPQFKMGDRVFRSGDRVMQTSNNYDKNVYNGDMGRIVNIDYEAKVFTVSFDRRPVAYEFAEVDQLALAYAITVHKAQGSEFPAVVIPLLNQHYMMLQRNLLYTAMTRARRLLILVGSRKAVSMAVRNAVREPRYTLLQHYLRAAVAPSQ
ncbi:MAG: ATP-dependent RecD-like DNA helicase [Victivallales bacterium]|nr:ATP-dependent RecD-like DNA helicase [Victivallales bacterium]